MDRSSKKACTEGAECTEGERAGIVWQRKEGGGSRTTTPVSPALPYTRSERDERAESSGRKTAPDRPPSKVRAGAPLPFAPAGPCRKPPPPWRLADLVVPRAVRDLVLAATPGLGDDRTARALVAHAVAGTARDAETGRPLLAAGVVAEAAGRRRAYESKNFNARGALEAVRDRTLPGLVWSDHHWSPDGDGRCRALVGLGLDPAARCALDAAARARPDRLVDPVGFVTGAPVTRGDRDRARAEARSAARTCPDARPASRRVADHLNGLPPHAFGKAVRRNLGAAYDAADGVRDPARRDHALRVLRAVELQPQPFYAARAQTETARVCAVGTTLLALPREVRAAMTAGWTALDLRAAQLAVVARDWDVGPLADFLAGGGDVWAELVGAVDPSRSWAPGSDGYAALKSAAKSFVYAAVFGMAVRRLAALGGDDFETARRALREVAGVEPEAASARLRGHPLVEAVLRSRARVFREIVGRGGAEDAFGGWVPCPSRKQASSVAALVAQAAELRLMLPVIGEAEREAERARAAGASPEWRVVAWLHDGCWVAASNRSKAARHVDRVRSVADEHARRLGYPTRLGAG